MDTNSNQARRVVIGITAHVDAGKTTLAEAMLYRTGQLRKLGRVDHGSAAMDSHLLERERGITIFLSQAELPIGNLEVTLLDTPGHVDFSAEMERTLSVLDYAILVISGVDGVQAHTRTLWRLLELYRVPTFLFVTKMDFGRRDRDCLMESLRHELGEGCVDFTPAAWDRRMEQLATCREDALEAYLDTGMVPEELVRQLVRQRLVFPCWFGSGLKLEGIDEFLEGLARYVEPPAYPAAFSARVFKISHDAQGKRLTHLKVTSFEATKISTNTIYYKLDRFIIIYFDTHHQQTTNMETPKNRNWKVLKSEYLSSQPWFTVRREEVELPNGNRIPEYYIFEYPEWINVIAITKEQKFVFVSQYRHGLGITAYELCAGVCEKEDASPLVSAQRELLEETGYGNGNWSELMVIGVNPSTHTNLTYCYLATDVESVMAQHLEDTEDLSVHLLTLDEVKELLLNDQIKQALHAAPLWKYMAMNPLRQWRTRR